MSTVKTTGVLMGKGAPNRQKTGRIVQCAIVLTPDLGFIRIWPLHPVEHKKITIWSVVSLELEKTTHDNRDESYLLKSIIKTGEMSDRIEKEKTLDRCCLKSGSTDPQFFQDANRKSIYLVKPEQILEHSICHNEVDPLSAQECPEEDGWIQDQNHRPIRAVVKWKSMQGSQHCLGVVAQGVCEYLRKYPHQAMRVFENLHLMDLKFDKWFLCGNQKDRRTSWVIVTAFCLKKTEKPNTPLFLPMFDGAGEDWPYLKQGAGNVKTAESGQMEFLFTSTTSSTISADCLGSMATTSCRSYANTAMKEYITNEVS
jgi:hypothetical protein